MSVADKLNTIVQNVPLVYKAGYDKSHDDFWDVFQDNGARTNYTYAFRFICWNQNTFRPKHDLIMVGAGTQAFEFFNQYGTRFDFAEHLQNLGIKFDTSGVTSAASMLYMTYVTRFPTIDLSSATTLSSCFRYSTAVIIDKVILNTSGSQTITNAFSDMIYLTDIVIEGVIGQNGVNLSASKDLKRESIKSFVNALSGQTTGLSITFSLTAVNKAFETVIGTANGSASAEWLELIATKSNWNISLI